MTKWTCVRTAVCAMALAAMPAMAAGVTKTKANFPFGFRAANVTLPAGEYTFEPSQTYGVLLVRNAEGKAAFVSARRVDVGPAAPGQMVFAKDGDAYALKELVMENAKIRYELK